MPGDIAPYHEVAGASLLPVVRAVERLCTHADLAAATGAACHHRLHIDRAVSRHDKHGRKSLPLLCGEAVEQYAPLLQQFRDLGICHLAVADNPVDEESALAVLPGVVLTAVALAGLHHIAAAHRATADNLCFCIHVKNIVDSSFICILSCSTPTQGSPR